MTKLSCNHVILRAAVNCNLKWPQGFSKLYLFLPPMQGPPHSPCTHFLAYPCTREIHSCPICAAGIAQRYLSIGQNQGWWEEGNCAVGPSSHEGGNVCNVCADKSKMGANMMYRDLNFSQQAALLWESRVPWSVPLAWWSRKHLYFLSQHPRV